MFGETEYDLNRQFSSVPIEEQLDALGKAVDCGKVNCSSVAFGSRVFPSLLLIKLRFLIVDQVYWT